MFFHIFVNISFKVSGNLNPEVYSYKLLYIINQFWSRTLQVGGLQLLDFTFSNMLTLCKMFLLIFINFKYVMYYACYVLCKMLFLIFINLSLQF